MEIFPDDTDVLVFDTRPIVGIVGRGEIFAKVERLFRVEYSLLNILRRFAASTRSAMFLVVNEGALAQLPRELMESVLRLFDIYAAGSG